MTGSSAGTYKIAFCSMMAALGTVIMLGGSVIPVFTYCSPIIAGVLLMAVREESGNGAAWMVWTVTGLLCILIGLDKEAAFFYVFIGWYPILKPLLDKIRPRAVRISAKLLIFTGAMGGMYFLTCFVLGIEEIVSSFSAAAWINLGFFAGIILCLGLYDRALNGMVLIYRYKFRPKLKFMNKNR